MEGMKGQIKEMLQGIERYNPENIKTLEHYVDLQARERGYDLEANLALLKLYQFNTTYYRMDVVVQILLKALMNLPHTDIVLCKCMLTQEILEHPNVETILYLADLLEICKFNSFWEEINKQSDLVNCVAGFEDAVRKFVCHVISITYQTIEERVLQELLGLVDETAIRAWTDRYGWKIDSNGLVSITNQEEIIKTRNITEKIDLDSVASIMASCY
uniref:Eukaryotic translation initiation factor 3 subunit K n=1 Tax=Labidocera rotunda TaxID=207950 RepID=A0A0U2IGJ4_9MAXI|nr:eukaryotic translation initiation factor 3 subunit K [Labidocera rotunda]